MKRKRKSKCRIEGEPDWWCLFKRTYYFHDQGYKYGFNTFILTPPHTFDIPAWSHKIFIKI